MKIRSRYRVPPTRALIAFESAARHRSFSKAAQELGTFQPAISRQIATLEEWVSIPLFERSSAGVTLTEAGSRLRGAIATGLQTIHRGVAEIEELSGDEQVVIGCSHETSQYFLLPRFNALCEILGEHVRVRVLFGSQGDRHPLSDPVADMVLTWNTAHAAPEHSVPVLNEAVRPVCSPGYALAHADILNGSVRNWGSLTLIDRTPSGEGWATWDDWFTVAGRPKCAPRNVAVDSYAYVLEAAAAGRGIALGWQGVVEDYFATDALVALRDEFVDFGNRCYCALTEKGRGKRLARKCLSYFEGARPAATS